MGLSVDRAPGRLTLRVHNAIAALYIFAEGAPLVHALGLPPKAIDNNEPAVYALGLEGSKTPRFELSAPCPLAVRVQRHCQGATRRRFDVTVVRNRAGERCARQPNTLRRKP
jgi:hypothetical protein